MPRRFRLAGLFFGVCMVENSYTAFGELAVAENTPFVQAAATYNFLPSNFRAYTATGGSTGVSNNLFRVETGTSVGGYGAIQSFRAVNYKPGEGAMARFTALFESSAANSWQGVGLVNLGDEISFGYNGTSFGVWHRYGGEAEVRTVTVTGAASGSENLTLTLNGTAYTIPLTSGTVNHNAFEIADWLNDSANQSVWHADQVDDTVILSALSDGAKSGAYSFSSSTATGSIAQDTAGVTKTSDFVAQSDWRGDDMTWLDPTKGNVYQIEFQYLGFGVIRYLVENPETGGFEVAHTIKWPNYNTTPSLGNPSLRLGLYAVSLGSTDNLIAKSASMAGFTQGQRARTRNPRAFSNTQSVGTSYTTVLALRNRKTYNGKFNQVEIQPLELTIANEGSKNIEVEIRSSTDFGVEFDYTAAGTNLVSDVSTSAVTVTSGRLLGAVVVAPGSSSVVDLSSLDIRLPPTLNFVVQAKKASGAAADVSASLIWYEDV
jgi:hypothetical protein